MEVGVAPQSVKDEASLDISEELITVLASENDDEFEHLKECVEMQKKYAALWEEKHEKAKDHIIALTSSLSTEQSSLSELNAASSECDSRHDQCRLQLTEAQQQLTAAKHQCAVTQGELQVRETEEEELEEKREALYNDTTKVIPEIRHDLMLYQYMSSVCWQYDGEDTDIKGYVSNKKEVKPFSLNAAQNSQYFITNYLWDLMENEWDKST